MISRASPNRSALRTTRGGGLAAASVRDVSCGVESASVGTCAPLEHMTVGYTADALVASDSQYHTSTIRAGVPHHQRRCRPMLGARCRKAASGRPGEAPSALSRTGAVSRIASVMDLRPAAAPAKTPTRRGLGYSGVPPGLQGHLAEPAAPCPLPRRNRRGSGGPLLSQRGRRDHPGWRLDAAGSGRAFPARPQPCRAQWRPLDLRSVDCPGLGATEEPPMPHRGR